MYINTYIIYKEKREWEAVEKARKADQTTSKGHSFTVTRFLKQEINYFCRKSLFS